MSYDSLLLALEAYRNSQSLDPQTLTKTIASLSFEALLGYAQINTEKFLEKPGIVFELTHLGRQYKELISIR